MLQVIPFDGSIDRSRFECGKPDLDHWLRQHAGQSERRDTTRTFLALGDEGDLAGYYAMKSHELDLDDAASAFGVGRRRYPVPAILLARLAVETSLQGHGIGSALLLDALQRMMDVSHSVGFEVVVVDAIDHDAAAFYGRFGFTSFADDPLHLFLTTEDLRLTFASQ